VQPSLLAAVRRADFEIGEALFQLLEPVARARQDLTLYIEFFAGYEIEAA